MIWEKKKNANVKIYFVKLSYVVKFFGISAKFLEKFIIDNLKINSSKIQIISILNLRKIY